MEKLINYLSGKKSTIFSIAQSIVVYLVATGQIDNDTAVLVTSVITALAGGTNYAEYRVGKSNK